MDKKLNLEQRLVHSLLFDDRRTAYELVLNDFVPIENREVFIQYVLDVLEAGCVNVLSDQLVIDHKKGTVWKLHVRR